MDYMRKVLRMVLLPVPHAERHAGPDECRLPGMSKRSADTHRASLLSRACPRPSRLSCHLQPPILGRLHPWPALWVCVYLFSSEPHGRALLCLENVISPSQPAHPSQLTPTSLQLLALETETSATKNT